MPKPNDDALALGLGKRKPVEQIREELNDSPFAGPAAEAAGATMVPVGEIKPSPYQSRGDLNPDHIEALSASIRESGLITPVLLRKVWKFHTSEYELIAGHHRVEAFKLLGRPAIPAIVREMSDHQAARALTAENAQHKALTDWEKFKHIQMLGREKAYKNQTDLANLLEVGRSHIINLEAFGVLPPDIAPILDRIPDLMGARLAYDLRKRSVSHPKIVSEAIHMLADGRLKQNSVLQWVEKKIAPSQVVPAAEHKFTANGGSMKCLVKSGEIILSGHIDRAKLMALLDQHKDLLVMPPDSTQQE